MLTKRTLSWLNYLRVSLGHSLWVITAFILTALILAGVVALFNRLGITIDLSQNLLMVGSGAVFYGIMLVIAIGLPWWVLKKPTDLATLGLQRSMNWKDIGLGLAGAVIYVILTAVLINLAMGLFSGFNAEQEQNLGLIAPEYGLEMILIFGLLVVFAPVVEEVIFRGYLYGKIRQAGVPFWLTALVVSLVFGAVHMQWNVAIDTFALSLVMCLTREASGTIWPSILIHMMKNGLAFYVLFVLQVGV